MPRRPSESASWILCYGCDRNALGAPLDVLWHDDKGIAVGRLRS
jgi:hypothetical protein